MGEPLTTPERIRTMGKEFTSLSDQQLNICIEDASLEVSSLNVPEEHKERLSRYLSAHLASLNIKWVTKEKVDVIERTYSDLSGSFQGLNTTHYGQEYQRILKNLPGRKKINLLVI